MAGNYNPWLVFLSIVVATVASYVALDLASRVVAHGNRASRYWLIGGALSMGTGIWSMHFIGMLAFQLPIPMSYDIPITLLSLVIAIIVSGFALYTVSHGTLSLHRLLSGGLLMGIGIASMHYTGMAAMQLEPPLRYDPVLFTLSVLIAIIASVVALWIAFQLRTETILSAFWKKAGSSLVMGAAITGMHYTGMAAANFAPNTICSVSPQDINNVWLAGAIGGFTFMFLTTTLLISVFDAHLANRAAKHAENLHLLNVNLEKHAAELSQTNMRLQEEVKERVRSEEQIQYLAYHDGLTALPNRALFTDRINHAISIAQRSQGQLAVLIIDLDHFKNVNDTLGHRIGDALLIEVAERLKSVMRGEDTVSRQGGDEFILVLAVTDADGAGHVAEKLLRTVAETCRIEQHELVITSSIGIAMYPDDGENFDTLSQCADVAMYRAKRDGRNNFRFFTAEMQLHSARSLQLENALRRALERNQLYLHYQPQISLQDGRVIGAEALLCWEHSEFGMISPAEFIPIAESSGQILPIGEWVLRTAVQQMKTWMDSGITPMVIAVNLSAVQFRHPNLPELVTQILDSARLPPQHLELELTEGVAMDDPLGAIAVMDSLHERGIRMSID
ncbi:MAG: MHYT domain-containing protein, partial [Gallionella sp.]